jgi:hypothetical protein
MRCEANIEAAVLNMRVNVQIMENKKNSNLIIEVELIINNTRLDSAMSDFIIEAQFNGVH